MNEAIKLAIEKGGYKVRVWRDTHEVQILLDPLFWQALGKALGWGVVDHYYGEPVVDADLEKMWLQYALLYMEIKLTGGDEEKFWKELLK